MDRLRKPIQDCLRGETDYSETIVEATNRRGRSIECKVVCSPLDDDGGRHGAIMLIEELEQSEE